MTRGWVDTPNPLRRPYNSPAIRLYGQTQAVQVARRPSHVDRRPEPMTQLITFWACRVSQPGTQRYQPPPPRGGRGADSYTLNDHKRHSTPLYHTLGLIPLPRDSDLLVDSRASSASAFCSTQLKMRSDSSITSRCRSAGRVTCGLLLSFLAFSTPAIAVWNGTPAQKDLTHYDQLPPIEPVFPGYGDAGDLAGAERFVRCS